MTTTVLCHGVFDVVHPGHLEHFKQAKVLGDRLVVAIVADVHVRKGPGRPMFNQKQRAEFLQALNLIDEVIIVDSPLAMPILERLKPEIFCKGPDYANPDNQFAIDFQREKAFVENYGGRVILTEGFAASSSAVIKRMGVGDPVIEDIRRKHGLEGVLSWLQRAKQVPAVVVGEEITDEYIYVRPLGKSGKENIVAFEPVGRESWSGGASIVEADLREFAAEVRRINNGPPVRKLRYVDEAFKQKLFSLVESPTALPVDLNLNCPSEGLLAVADYGHGLLDRESACNIAHTYPSRFLAITVQSNAANWGFNLLTKWPRANYVVVDRNELQLACADRTTHIGTLALQMKRRMKASYFAVTLGHEGCLVLGNDTEVRLSAVADKVVDRMGAGDAFLAATAPLAWVGAPPEIIALVGNVAGAIKVGKLGNQPVLRTEVEAWLKRLIG